MNGKDIRKVMTNACYLFDTFATIFKAGKRPNYMLSDANINALCMQFREVFVLWDGGEEAKVHAVRCQHQCFMHAVS